MMKYNICDVATRWKKEGDTALILILIIVVKRAIL